MTSSCFRHVFRHLSCFILTGCFKRSRHRVPRSTNDHACRYIQPWLWLYAISTSHLVHLEFNSLQLNNATLYQSFDKIGTGDHLPPNRHQAITEPILITIFVFSDKILCNFDEIPIQEHLHEKTVCKWQPCREILMIWVRSRSCGCLFTWFCYHLVAKPGNKTDAPSWPDPYILEVHMEGGSLVWSCTKNVHEHYV